MELKLQSDTVEQLMPAFIKTIEELGNPVRNKAGHSYKYVDLATMTELARPVLAANDLVVTQTVYPINDQPTLVTTLFHKSGEFLRSYYDLVEAGLRNANNAQQMGGAITYARRYTLAALLFIAQADDDAASVGNKTKELKAQEDELNNEKQAFKIEKARLEAKIKFVLGVMDATTVEQLETLVGKGMEWIEKNLEPADVAEIHKMVEGRLSTLRVKVA